MTISTQDRISEFSIRWYRDSSGNIYSVVRNANLTELHDDVAGTWTPIREVPSDVLDSTSIDAVVNSTISTQTAEITSLNAQLTAANATISALQAQVTDLTASVTSLNSAKNQSDQNLAAANASLATSQANLATAQSENAPLQSQITQLTSDKAALQSQIDALTAPPTVPYTFNYRFKLALAATPSVTGDPTKSMLDDANAAVMAAGQTAEIYYGINGYPGAPQFYANDPLLLELAQGLGKTQTDINNLFTLAQTFR